MTKKIQLLMGCGVLSLASASLGQDISNTNSVAAAKKFYFGTDLGPAFLQTVNIVDADQIKFNTGIRGDLNLGYRLTPWLATELSTGVIWNSADTIGGVALSSYGGSLDLYQIPMLGSAIFTLPLQHGFDVNVGAGAGAVASILHFNSPLGDIHNTDYTFAYQFFSGLNYRLAKNVEVGVGFKLLRTNNHYWEENGVTMTTGGTMTYSVTGSFTWLF